MKLYWRLLGFAKPIGRYAVPYFFYTLFYALFNTFNFVMIIPLLRTLFGAGEAVEHITTAPEFRLSVDYLTELLNYWLFSLYGENYGAVNVLVILAVFVTVSAFLSNMFRYLGQRTIENLRINTIRNMRNLVFDNIMGLNLGYFTSARKGDVMSRITNDIQTVRFCIVNTLQVAFREPFLIIGYIVAMVAISWELTLFAVIYLPLIALIIGGIVKKLRKPALIAQEKFGEITSVLDESLSGTKVIKAYTAEGFFRRKFQDINHTYSELARKMMNRQQLASPMSEFMGIAAAAGLLVFGGALVLGGQSGLDGSGFIAYIAIFTQITRPMSPPFWRFISRNKTSFVEFFAKTIKSGKPFESPICLSFFEYAAKLKAVFGILKPFCVLTTRMFFALQYSMNAICSSASRGVVFFAIS